MKKTIFILTLTLLSVINVKSQNYYISFTGSGDTTNINSVQVDNLTKGTSIMITGSDTLHLVPFVGIETLNFNKSLEIYPNPMVDVSNILFRSSENSNSILKIVDLSGKLIYQTILNVSTGINKFQIIGVKKGIFILQISNKTNSYITKLVSQSNLENNITISGVSFFDSQYFKKSTSIVDMEYSIGDQLKYKGLSGIYSSIVMDIPNHSKTTSIPFSRCQDANGHNYTTVKITIGNKSTISEQTWMAENLNVGEAIQANTGQSNNLVIEKYCFHDSTINCTNYGGLYTWDEMMGYDTIPGIQGVCPDGWRIPTDNEWRTMVEYYGGDSVGQGVWATAGGSMKETGYTHWQEPNTGATNITGFSARGHGAFYPGYGFVSLLTDAPYHNSNRFWDNVNQLWGTNVWTFEYVTDCAFHGGTQVVNAFAVRCVHD